MYKFTYAVIDYDMGLVTKWFSDIFEAEAHAEDMAEKYGKIHIIMEFRTAVYRGEGTVEKEE